MIMRCLSPSPGTPPARGESHALTPTPSPPGVPGLLDEPPHRCHSCFSPQEPGRSLRWEGKSASATRPAPRARTEGYGGAARGGGLWGGVRLGYGMGEEEPAAIPALQPRSKWGPGGLGPASLSLGDPARFTPGGQHLRSTPSLPRARRWASRRPHQPMTPMKMPNPSAPADAPAPVSLPPATSPPAPERTPHPDTVPALRRCRH